MMNTLTLSGIYDQRSLELINSMGIYNVEFDFRPKSFNFIQKHILDSLKDHIEIQSEIFLHFQGEPDFMVNDILNLFEDSLKKPTLVFSDLRSKEYYSQFGLPFYWHYEMSNKSSDIIGLKECAGIVISYALIEESLKTTNIRTFISNLYAAHPGLVNKKIGLEVSWNSNIAPSVLEYIDFDFIKVSINSDVEVCYRNIDAKKLKDNVSLMLNLS